jgi:hypothetical protein
MASIPKQREASIPKKRPKTTHINKVLSLKIIKDSTYK